MSNKPIILLFRQDLRLKDNPALTQACETGQPIIPLYIYDDMTPGDWKMGGASKWWLHYSLSSLDDSLRKKGSQLFLYKGETVETLTKLVQLHNVSAIYWNRCYEPYAIKLEQKLKKIFPVTKSFSGSLLFEPWEITNKQGLPFKVFTPFWNHCKKLIANDAPLPEPKQIFSKKIESENLDSWHLLPEHPDWAGGLRTNWNVGEVAAHHKLNHFLKKCISTYENDRNIPSLNGTSMLSPYLHFGEISPRQIFHAAKGLHNSEKFLSEIGWREFSYYQLYNFAELPEQPWRAQFSKFPWEYNPDFLIKWQKGETGYPIVDAGMRQLWATGWMHNRVRMITASFLIKHLLLPWQEGEKWFWDTLVDADLACNAANWQWVAGCGFDAAPYFRIFNPVLQGQKFDPDGIYIKRWIPELAEIAKTAIHMPWKNGENIKCGYPSPVVDHQYARQRALQAFKKIST